MNKIKFGLRNVRYAIASETLDSQTGKWSTTYGAYKPWAGAVSIALDPQGDSFKFYADDGVYAQGGVNSGYEGDFESALIPEDVEESILNKTLEATDKVVLESSDDANTVTYFALAFEFTGDNTGKRYVLYRCSLTRPSIAGQTKADSVDVQTESVTITATPRLDDDHLVSAHTGDTTTQAVYDAWYNEVYLPS